MDHQVFLFAACIAICALGHVKTCHGQIVLFGGCEKQNVTVKSDFDASKYMGKWHEQKRYFVEYERGLKCVTAQYTALPDGVQVLNSGIKSSNGENSTALGEAIVPNAAEPAKLSVQFPRSPAGDLWIVDTDYETYSVAYSCRNAGPFRLESAWLLSRKPDQFSNETMSHIDDILRKNNIEKEAFLHVDQSSCSF
ncbi:ApoD1 [Ramazzottius varieornatus]|uniref:Apolipoprotein D n=1 Tax=Ramazzottius varieornatus TaxID=947166 RepID=A0A1D1UJR8_RAMVA|nr:ApoD1 [Ramazzottius varieornatus]